MSINAEIQNVENQLKIEPKTKLLKLKHNLLYAYLLNLKLFQNNNSDVKDKDNNGDDNIDSDEIKETLKELSTLLDKILKIENKINYNENCKGLVGKNDVNSRNITLDMMKNKSIFDKFKKKSKGSKNKMRKKGDNIKEKRKITEKKVSTKKTRSSRFN
ncbi:hypothetical protein DMUE_1563 [Dictyocoela muelleri]|nr:hypothetical protein DMUE_1563 [Dictyocoela muelleri]